MNSFISNSRSLKNQSVTPSGCKDLGITTFKRVVKTQFLYTKMYIYKIVYKNCRFKQIIFYKYVTNLKSMISQRSLKYLGLLLLLFEFNNFHLQKKWSIIIFIRPYHMTRTPTKWQCSILVIWYRQRHMIIIHCHWWEFWSHDTDLYIILSIISFKNEQL